MSGTIQDLSFCDLLISINIFKFPPCYSKCQHFPRCNNIPLYVENTFFFFFFEITFSLSIDGHLGSFHIPAVVNYIYSYDSHSISYFTTFSLIFLI